ncbi:MAG TPA: lipid-binding SYLF domain-containing protein [Kiloniellaceae bacterium]|nr:lipid-binding SYLF domain-containing protein [Kiloniellaceae bacterium]
MKDALPSMTRRLGILLFAIALSWGIGINAAKATSEQEELVTKAQFTIENMLADPEELPLKDYVDRAKGIFIIPTLIKGAFILGGEGGNGVLLVKGSDGSWSDPAFYTLGGASIGLQIGGEVSQAVFTLMTDEAVASFLSSEFKFGGDLSVAVGPKGAGIGASSTTNVAADIYAFSMAVGLFGGGALNGAKIFARDEWNTAYYGPDATPKAIVIERKYSNPQSGKLRAAIP